MAIRYIDYESYFPVERKSVYPFQSICINRYTGRPICVTHEAPPFFSNMFTYQLSDSGNKYRMIACIAINALEAIVMKCVEEIRPISRRFTLLEMDCNYLNIPFEEGLEVFDANECNWIKL